MDMVGVSINRKFIMQKLNEVAPTYAIGQAKTHDSTYIVLRAASTSTNGSSVAYIQPYEILCYVPSDSILYLDSLVEEVKAKMKECSIEISGELGVDYYDADIKMYMRYVTINIPREV